MQKSTVFYGPPGTGKTTSLVKFISESAIDPERIVVASFTRAAAKEITDRLPFAGVRSQTLHSIAYKLAGITNGQVFNRDWAKEFTKATKIDIKMASANDLEELAEGDRYLALYSYGRSTLNQDWRSIFMGSGVDGSLQRFLYFVDSYDQFKSAYGLVDFSDMLDMARGADPATDLLVLDEAQDFSDQQWSLIESWLPFVNQIVLAGDDDQAIYKWSGANPHGMNEFELRHNSTRIVLDQSYRIPLSVHHIAQGVIDHVKKRVPKEYKPRSEIGKVVKCNSIRQIPLGDSIKTLILVRNHSLRSEIEQDLMDMELLFSVDGGLPGPLENYYAKAIRSWIKAQYNYQHIGDCLLPDSDIKNLQRCAHSIYKARMGEPEDFITKSWNQVLQLPRNLSTYYTALINKYGSLSVVPNIRISTIHNSKGRESDRVILINGMTNRTAEGDRDSELRTFYVGATRSKSELYVVAGINPLRELL